MKLLIKKLAISIGLATAPYLPTRSLRSFFYNKITPFLIDPRVLPMGLVIRPARRFGLDILCDPYVYVHQSYYWCGVFYEEEVENYILREIKAGDTVIDVGMNVGHVSIPAAKLVGSQGRVIAFEPNIDLVKRVETLASKQGLKQLTIKPFGLGSSQGTFLLNMDCDHSGGATFRKPLSSDGFNMSIEVKVEIGDEVLHQEKLLGRIFLKMDVEGCEIDALKGLTKTLKIVDHAIVEISPEWLNLDDLMELSAIMEASGFDSFYLADNGKAGAPVHLKNIVSQSNILFLRK